MPDMALSAFEGKKKQLYIEKINDNYYLTLSVDNTVVSNLELILGTDKVGEIITTDGNIERHTYSLSLDNIQSTLNFRTKVIAMDRVVEFTVAANYSGATKVGDVTDLGERPGEFVPTIFTSAGNTEVEKGAEFLIPSATSKLGTETPEVVKTVYYIKDGIKQPVQVNNGKFKLDNVGTYLLQYKAESNQYKTSLGNNTYSTREVFITSKIGASIVGKFEDINNVLPVDSMLQAYYVTEGTIYEKAKSAMKGYADNFDVVSVDIFDKTGNEIKPEQNIKLYLRANDYFNRKNIEVYYMADDGSVTKCNTQNHGRYISLDTKNIGTFIICVEGVAFVMPMWGYALITVFSVILLVVIIVVPVVVVKKKKKKEMIAKGTYVEKNKTNKVGKI